MRTEIKNSGFIHKPKYHVEKTGYEWKAAVGGHSCMEILTDLAPLARHEAQHFVNSETRIYRKTNFDKIANL
jgi:hypothetical protein